MIAVCPTIKNFFEFFLNILKFFEGPFVKFCSLNIIRFVTCSENKSMNRLHQLINACCNFSGESVIYLDWFDCTVNNIEKFPVTCDHIWCVSKWNIQTWEIVELIELVPEHLLLQWDLYWWIVVSLRFWMVGVTTPTPYNMREIFLK